MKRLLKITAILVIGVLAARPVLSSLTCAVRMVASCAPDCPMGTSAKAADCPMTGAVGATPDCCTFSAFEAVLERTGHQKSKVALLSLAAIPVDEMTAGDDFSPIPVTRDPRSSSPPRYIVNRVFRI